MQNHKSNDATWSLNRDVHEPPRSPYWFASYRDSDGRRVRRSTKTTDRTLAQEIAMKWAQLAQAGRAGRLTESQCRNVIAEMYEKAVGEPLHFTTTRVHLAQWLESSKTDTTAGTYGQYKQIVGTFLAHIGIKADRLLREVSSADIRAWRDAQKIKGLSARTINGYIKILRMPFKAAHDNGLIDLNPLTKTSVKLLKDDAENVTKDVFTPAQVGALIAAAPSQDWAGMITLGFTSGLRLRDCAELRWSNVDLDAHTITIETRKTRKKILLPIHPSFEQWLKRQVRGIGRAAVFPSLAGKRGHGRTGLSGSFSRIMRKAGIEGRKMRDATGAGSRPHSSLSFHSLRHSFNSALQAAGIGVEVRQQLVGHSSIAMNRQYTHPDVATLRAAVLKLPAIPKARGR